MRSFLYAVAVLALVGCGANNYTGTFYSQWSSALYGSYSTSNYERIVFTLSQSGNYVTGTFTGENSKVTGQFTGMANGDQLTNFTMLISQSTSGCSQFTGSGSYNNRTMLLNYSANCAGSGGFGNSGTITAVRAN